MPGTTSLEGKRILVTGGSTGVGRATIALLAKEGARIVTFGRHDETLQEAIPNARGWSGTAVALTADTARREDVDRVYDVVDANALVDPWSDFTFRAEQDPFFGLTACSAYSGNGGSFKPIDYLVEDVEP
jgi:NAD(P)-dependent dehydrogenase (short-subunit alcohol dehydrogenase family)